MALPGQSFFSNLVNPPTNGPVGIQSGTGILEHLQANNAGTTAADFLWLQLFLNGPALPGGTPSFVFPLGPTDSLFWTPPTAAAGGIAVIGVAFNECALAASSNPGLYVPAAGAGFQFWAWGRGT